MNTPAPDWMTDASKATYPGWVQRKAVTLYKRDQKRGGVGNVQQYRLAIHEAVLASQGHDHWTCLLYTSPSPRDRQKSRMPSSA